jgi:uncharacterized cofD-like protein
MKTLEKISRSRARASVPGAFRALPSRARAREGAAPAVTVIGGGSGLSALLAGLKAHTDRLTAVVAVTDEGGSSGRLRRAWGMPPPGDLRNCLVALADDGALLSRLFQYRFPRGASAARGNSLAGHSFGNLFLAALTSVCGGFDEAIAAAGQVLAVRGRVLPVSLAQVRLYARLADGRRVVGETLISNSSSRIRRVGLLPASPQPSPGVLEAIASADVVVLGPGSLYTSVIPPLLARGVAEALRRSRALKIYACNLMTQPGETDGHGALDHLESLLGHLAGPSRSRTGAGAGVDAMLANDAVFPEAMLKHYARHRSFPVAPPEHDVWRGVRIVRADLRPEGFGPPAGGLEEQRRRVRHSPERLARAVMNLFRERRRGEAVSSAAPRRP